MQPNGIKELVLVLIVTFRWLASYDLAVYKCMHMHGLVCFGMEFGLKGLMGIYRGWYMRLRRLIIIFFTFLPRSCVLTWMPSYMVSQELWALRKRRGPAARESASSKAKVTNRARLMTKAKVWRKRYDAWAT